MILAFCQAPGRIAADTKLDLTADPLAFLTRAAHQWSSIAPLGQVQNQAYGYFFPHGGFFLAGHLAHIPPWVTQRLWWGLLLAVGFWGVVRVADALGVGSRTSRMVAAAAFVLFPRVLTTIGPISSETLPMMLAPWVLLPVILALDRRGPGSADPDGARLADRAPSMRMLAARSAAAVAMMGAVNAVATGFACLIAGLWWIAHRPDARWRRFTAWWIPALAIACAWWIVPLWLLGQVSPPFLDFIESSVTTTRWTSLPEVLRGTSSWTPFVSPGTATGVSLVNQPILVLATGLLAAAGLAGLAMRRMPAKGRLVAILLVGVAGMAIGYDGALGSAVAEQVRSFLDGAGAPLRNVHKLDPLIRLPLVLGLAHLLGRVPLPGAAPWRRARGAFAHPEHEPMVAVTALVAAGLVLASGPAWLGNLAPRGSYTSIPDYWGQASDWLTAHSGPSDSADAVRALVVPGAPFAIQTWGMTRDEPLQALADSPWAVRDAIPLTPPGAIRALDAVQRQLVSGRSSDTLVPTLERMGVGYLVVRNDLDPELARAAPPIVVHEAVDGSPGLTRVAAFGDPPVPATTESADSSRASDDSVDAGSGTSGSDESDSGAVHLDSGLRHEYPAIEIYRVGDEPVTVGPYAVDADQVPTVVGGPESLARPGVARPHSAPDSPPQGSRDQGAARPTPIVRYADGRAAGLPAHDVTVTDTPTDREQNYGRVDGGTSGIRAEGDPRRTPNAAADYPVPGAELVRGQWQGADVTASSSASDATQLGGVTPSGGPASAFDGDDVTSWVSGDDRAVGQWLRLDLDEPIRSGVITLRTSPLASGAPVTDIEVITDHGTSGVAVPDPGAEVTVPIPLGTTSWLRIEATGTADGSGGGQFGLSEVSVEGADGPIDIRRRVVVPPPPEDVRVSRWSLGQEFPGHRQCIPVPGQVLCDTTLGASPEAPQPFTRTLDIPTDAPLSAGLTVRARPGGDLNALLAAPGQVRGDGGSDIVDPRGNASAALDGQPETSWYAADADAHHATSSPTLTLALPHRETVSSLRITPPPAGEGGSIDGGDSVPARPTTVTVDLGTGPQQRIVPDDGVIDLTPADTDKVTVSVTDWQKVRVQGAFGQTTDEAPGIAEIAAFTGPEATGRIGSVPDPDRTVTVGCDAGPVIAFAGRYLNTSITAPASALRNGDPVTAEPCDNAPFVPVPGRQDVDVQPGGAFTVESVTLDAGAVGAGDTVAGSAGPAGAAANRAGSSGGPASAVSGSRGLNVTTWSDDHRQVTMPASAQDRLLVVPESTNPGWAAETASGDRLVPIVVNGWQQGWIVPAGEATTVTLSYPTDRWYRLGLFGGLALLPLLFLAAALRPLRKERTVFGAPTRTWSSAAAGVVGVLALGAAVAGAAGLEVAAAMVVVAGAAGVVGAGRAARAVRSGRAWPVIAGVGLMVSAGVLATGPWLSGAPYEGHSVAAQLPALIALVAVSVSAVPTPVRLLARARAAWSRRSWPRRA